MPEDPPNGEKNTVNHLTTLADLPPELLDNIASYLPTARSLASLASTSRDLNAFIEKDAWHTFARARFPSLHPRATQYSGKQVAGTLTALSRAFDQRAFISRYIEPSHDIRTYPGNKKTDFWKKPGGQTIGYTPQLDCYEEIGSSWARRKEVLAFSAGSGVCVRQRRSGGYGSAGETDGVTWMTHRPIGAIEGKDDITALHLVRPPTADDAEGEVRLVTGTANGDLQLITLSTENSGDVPRTYFTTQGMGIRSSALSQEPSKPAMIAASLHDTRVCLYPVDASKPKITPISQIELRCPDNGRRGYRAWSTNFLSSSHLAVGVGPSEEPIHIYQVSPSGLTQQPIRKFGLQNDLVKLEGDITLSGSARKSSSSVYPTVPLPPSSSSAAGHASNVFLSGAYDGIIRLHDLRSNRDVDSTYIDPTDESAIYSLLTRGQEKLIAGTSRHTLMKVFDLRLGAKAYTYMDASDLETHLEPNSNIPTAAGSANDWNLFLKPNRGTYPGHGGGNNWARRSAESSIYSLTSPAPHNPHIFAGVENAVVEMAFTSVFDRHADPAFFKRGRGHKEVVGGWRDKEIWDLAMYDQEAGLKLMTQRNVGEMKTEAYHARTNGRQRAGRPDRLPGLDERWRAGGS